MIYGDGTTPLYLINPLILERFRSRPEEWRREWTEFVRMKINLHPWVQPVTGEGVEECAALLWWVTYYGSNYRAPDQRSILIDLPDQHPADQQPPAGGDHADTL